MENFLSVVLFYCINKIIEFGAIHTHITRESRYSYQVRVNTLTPIVITGTFLILRIEIKAKIREKIYAKLRVP